MNLNFEPDILSPLSQYLQEGGSQGSMGTPRPGTPRGSHFRLSPDGTLNPGTPGAASHDHHKLPNSPWSGSEPATPGSGYSRNVVPTSPYVSSYPNTPATPGGGGFYPKPMNGTNIPTGNGTTTDPRACTPGPMTPLTPATPMGQHNGSSMGDHNGNGYSSNNSSPTYPSSDSGISVSSNIGKPGGGVQQPPQLPPQQHTLPELTGLASYLQDAPPQDSLVPVMHVMNHNHHHNNNGGFQESAPPSLHPPPLPVQENGNSSAPLQAPSLPPISDSDISQAVDSNPNLISEFEEFFEGFLRDRKKQETKNLQQPPIQQLPPPPPQQQQQPQPMPLPHHVPRQQPGPPQIPDRYTQQLLMMNSAKRGGVGGNGGMMYNNNIATNNTPNGPPPMSNGMMMNGHLLNNGMPMSMTNSMGPMRTNKFVSHGHNGHPYMMPNNGNPGNGMMMRNQPLPPGGVHMQQHNNNQHNQFPMQSGGPPSHHPNMMNMNMQNMMGPVQGNQGQYLQGHNGNPSASVYAPPSGNNGGYVHVQQMPPHPQRNGNMGNPAYGGMQSAPPPNGGPGHWQPPPPQQQPPQPIHQPMNNVNPNMNMMVAPNRGIPQQPNSYFQNPVNSVNQGVVEHNLNNGGSVLPPTTYSFDLNNGPGGGSSVGGGSSSNSLSLNSGTSSAMQVQPPSVPVQPSTPLSVGMSPQPTTLQIPDDIDLDGPYDGPVSQSTWAKALEKATRPNPVSEVGKVLFDEIFTDDEVIHCTLSGRGSTKKFNPNKVIYLKKAVAWLMTRPARPMDFNAATCDLTLAPDDETGLKGLEKKVFTEYRSRRRGDILKARGQSVPTPTTPSSTS